MHVILLLFLLLSEPLTRANLTSTLEGILSSQKYPYNGLVLVAQGNKIIYEKTVGSLDPPHGNSRFFIASLSKQITAALVLQAVDRGELDLDVPIAHYLPHISELWANQITLHHLLTHRSGFVRFDQPLAFAPGTQFLYGNEGYDQLMGPILEVATGRPYASLAHDLFQSLEMKDSLASPPGNLSDLSLKIDRLTPGHTLDTHGNPIPPPTYEVIPNPSGNLVSTGYDLLKWNLGLHQGKVLSTKNYQRMIAPYKGKLGYGYEIKISQCNGAREYSHHGRVPGYFSTLSYFPESQISIILLENCLVWAKGTKVHQSHDQIVSTILATLSEDLGQSKTLGRKIKKQA